MQPGHSHFLRAHAPSSGTATSSTTIAKCTPQEELADELNRYFRFEATPMEQQEGYPNISGELLAQDVLLNPLIWWKVSCVLHLLS